MKSIIQMIRENKKVKSCFKKPKKEGFTLIETIISLALVTVVFVSLAQLFTLAVMQNLRSNEMSNAIFLAQQQIDFLRTLTSDELTALTNRPADELIDINGDGTLDFRRITTINSSLAIGTVGFDVQVLVFPISAQNVAAAQLIANPDRYRARAQIHTIISR